MSGTKKPAWLKRFYARMAYHDRRIQAAYSDALRGALTKWTYTNGEVKDGVWVPRRAKKARPRSGVAA